MISGRNTLLGLLLLVGLPLAAQDPVLLASVGNDVRESHRNLQFLERPAGVEADRIPLPQMLQMLRDEAGIRLTFSPSLVPEGRTVTCRCASVTVSEALNRVLSGTGLRWEALGSHIVIEPVEDANGALDKAQRRSSRQLADQIALRAPSGNSLRPRGREARIARTGTVQGRVTHARTGQPVPAAQVFIRGTQLGTLTDQSGNYQISDVPAGEHTVEVQLIGFAQASADITVRSGDVTSQNFRLTERALDLDGIVVTGTAGGMERRAIGNVVGTLNTDAILDRAPIHSTDQLIGQREAGAMTLPGTGQVGTGSAIRIRGNSSLALENEPIIYIDGVRMDSDPRRGPGQRGGSNVSRLNDIHPSDIESIEIIKGPAAATLYGTEASNGVIQIITRRGATGEASFDLTTRFGTNWIWDPAGRVDDRYYRNPDNPDEILSANLYENERVNGAGDVFSYGRLASANLNVRGGTDNVRYFASVSRDDNQGVMAQNWEERTSMRANTELLLSESLTANISTSYSSGAVRLGQSGLTADIWSNIIFGDARRLDADSRGFLRAPPEELRTVESRADNERFTASAEFRFEPAAWNSHRMVVGIDSNNEENWTLWPQKPEGADHFFGQLGLGQKSVNRGERRFVTLDYSASANFSWQDYDFRPSLGFQYFHRESAFISSVGSEFPAVPITTVSGGAVRDAGESFVENTTVGVFFQQQVGWEDRRFLTAAVRLDDNSAFGTEFDAAVYPKVSWAWVLHEEPFWRWETIDQFRFRGAWGQAGQQPGTFDAARLYAPVIGGGDRAALLPDAFGNPQLKPERGEELEVGFDASFLDGRISLEYTRFQRTMKDAIVNRPLPPSSGFTGSQVVNLGRVSAWGNEIGASLRLLESPTFAWELDTQFSTTKNEIKTLGELDFIPAGGQGQHRQGYSVGDLFMRHFLEAELNEQGQLVHAMCDGGTGPQGVDPGGSPVPCGEAPQVWLGHSQPTWQLGIGNTFSVGESLILYGRLEGNGGHYQLQTHIRANHNLGTTESIVRGDNAMLAAVRSFENDRTSVYDASFVRLREVSATYYLPEGLARGLRADRGSVSLGFRNLAMIWTGQEGFSTPRSGLVRESLAGQVVHDVEVRAVGQHSNNSQTVLPAAASAVLTLRLSF